MLTEFLPTLTVSSAMSRDILVDPNGEEVLLESSKQRSAMSANIF
jgi:hypothetical protein